MANVKLYIASDYSYGDTIIGWKADDGVEVEVVDLDPVLPDPWEISTIEEAEAGLATVTSLAEQIRDLEGPGHDDFELDREAYLVDLEFLRDELLALLEDLDAGLPNPRLLAYDTDYALAAASEPTLSLDDMPSEVREAYDDACDCGA